MDSHEMKLSKANRDGYRDICPPKSPTRPDQTISSKVKVPANGADGRDDDRRKAHRKRAQVQTLHGVPEHRVPQVLEECVPSDPSQRQDDEKDQVEDEEKQRDVLHRSRVAAIWEGVEEGGDRASTFMKDPLDNLERDLGEQKRTHVHCMPCWSEMTERWSR